MKKLQASSPRLLWLCGLAIVVTACDNNSNPASPSAMLEPGGTRVYVCHRTSGGTYMKLEVSASAVAGHMGHGDGMPNSESFDGNCAVVSPAPTVPPPPPPPPDPLPLTLSCGAPAGAANPGSTVFPGPTVVATTGALLQFLVTANPAPASGTRMVRETRDTFATTETVLQTTVSLDAGSYQGSTFVSSGSSFIREIRFTLDGASCSLFWSINR